MSPHEYKIHNMQGELVNHDTEYLRVSIHRPEGFLFQDKYDGSPSFLQTEAINENAGLRDQLYCMKKELTEFSITHTKKRNRQNRRIASLFQRNPSTINEGGKWT